MSDDERARDASTTDPLVPAAPTRPVLGVSAVLLPFDDGGDVDWASFRGLLDRTLDAGLVPAVDMDTGYVQLIDVPTRTRVLDAAADRCGDAGFFAGAYVDDGPGDALDLGAYAAAMTAIAERGGTPVVFPSHGLTGAGEDQWVAAHIALGARFDRFVAFELGEMFVPYGRIWSVDAFAGLMDIETCIGAKHSSLARQPEWERLARRDQVRPDFHVFTGNDLAIDMICYGSDYLLGLSAFAPDAFAERDRRWADGDPAFRELNDLLQYLGFFAFRPPVPAYRHAAALFLQARGWIASDRTPSGAPRRARSDQAVLVDILARLEAHLEGPAGGGRAGSGP
jgi:dihydrodipicolinate synthase/N-acetylneuraminate lyase